MALPFAKLTIIIGAGLVGSVLAKEGRMPGVFDIFSGASKVLKILKTDDKSTSNTKPVSDALIAQVNNLRQELQLLASSRPVTIVTTNGSGGTNKYSIVIIVAATGYGYIWWKGWKLPDMMFATKRSLSDATNAVAKQLETVYSSLSTTKRELSSRLDGVGCKLEEISDTSDSTKLEISEMRGDTKRIALDFQSVHNAVSTLESKISRIEFKQDGTNAGVARLLRSAMSMENQASANRIQGNPSTSSRPALELPQRTISLPAVQIEELQLTPPRSPRALQGNRDSSEASNTPSSSNRLNISEEGSTSSGVFGRTLSGLGSVFSITRPPKRQ